MNKNKYFYKDSFALYSYIKGILPNILASIFIFIFFAYTIDARPRQFLYTLLSATVLYIITFPTVFYISNKLITKQIDRFYIRWKKGEELSVEERTEMFKNIQAYPIKNGVVTYVYYMILTFALAFIFNKFPVYEIDRITRNIAFYSCYFGSYIITIVEYTNKEKMCEILGEQLVKEGIDENAVNKKKFFGASIAVRCIFYLIFPALLMNLLLFINLIQGYKETNKIIFTGRQQEFRIIISSIISIIISFSLYILYYKQIERNMEKLRVNSTKVISDGLSIKERADTALQDQMQYNVYVFNQILNQYEKLLTDASKISRDLLKTTDSLSIISTQISSTSQEQSADVKEILATMEDANALSQNIESRINQVSNDTFKTKEEVSEAFEALHQTIEHINAISDSNRQVITGINTLDELVNGIDSIVSIITDIADQTKTVAFNAELESISAKEDGYNFHIIATEIRRLANSMVSSIQEIHANINNIMDASKSLLQKSNEGTDSIQKENSLIHDLEEQFNLILKSSNETDNRTGEIINTVEQQTTSFNQIVITLRQISAGIERFTESTEIISTSVNEMKNIAEDLYNLKDNQYRQF